MPTPVSSARLCLSGDAAAALDAAVAAARRRAHAQTTSLHVIFSLLSSSSASSPILRDALSRSRSSAYSPRLQFKALELCFGVALDRLPSSSSSAAAAAAAPLADEPPLSNSLMAAIKRSQANQRRNPDTFHLYQQQQSCSSSSSFSGVKVELQQLILAILDDPVVSRVFGEAGFRSCDIKLSVLRPAPPLPLLRFPCAAVTRRPPLFLCSFSAGDDVIRGRLPFLGSDEHCRRIGDVISRWSNPMLVGAGAGDAARDFSLAVQDQNWSALPPELKGLKLIPVRTEDSNRIEQIAMESDSNPGLVFSIGDLKELIEEEDRASKLVSEITKILEIKRGRLFVMGWSATYETYLKFLSKYPLLDKDWDLQLLPITSVKATSVSFNKSHSFVPFGGFFAETLEPMGLVRSAYNTSVQRCESCNSKYEQEAMTILRASPVEIVDQVHANLPPWLNRTGVEARDENKLIVSGKIVNLQKKWNDYCHLMHNSTENNNFNNYPIFPQFIPVTHNSESRNSEFHNSELQNHGPPKQTISLPLIPEPRNETLISKLQSARHTKSEQLHLHATEKLGEESPTSVNSVTVTTDLSLAIPQKDKSPFPPSRETPVTETLDLSNYKRIFSDIFERVGRRQEGAVRAVSEAVVRGDRWLRFIGPDRVAQKRAVTALADILCGGKENVICVDLGCGFYDLNFRGRTSVDYIAGEIYRNTPRVVFIENADQADFTAQESLTRAVKTGRLPDSHGREICINNVIFVLSSRGKGIFGTEKESCSFTEENILSVKGRGMKILTESSRRVMGERTSGRVVISPRREGGKRKSEICNGNPKRLNLGFDLNMPVDESESNYDELEDDSDSWVDNLDEFADRTVEFQPFHFDALADEVIRDISRVFCEKFRSENCILEIEVKVMEQILAVGWAAEGRGAVSDWVERVLGTTFGAVKQRFGVPSPSNNNTVFRLVLSEEESGVQLLLPSKIVVMN